MLKDFNSNGTFGHWAIAHLMKLCNYTIMYSDMSGEPKSFFVVSVCIVCLFHCFVVNKHREKNFVIVTKDFGRPQYKKALFISPLL